MQAHIDVSHVWLGDIQAASEDRIFAGMAKWPSLTDLAANVVNNVILDRIGYDVGIKYFGSERRPYLQLESPLGRRLLEDLLTQQVGFTYIARGARTWAVRSPGPDQYTAYAVRRRRGLKILDPKYRQQLVGAGQSEGPRPPLSPSQELAFREIHDDDAYNPYLQPADSALRFLLHLRDKFIEQKSAELSLEVEPTLTHVLGESSVLLSWPHWLHLNRWLTFLGTIDFGQVVFWREGWEPTCVQKWPTVLSMYPVGKDFMSVTIDPRTVSAVEAFSGCSTTQNHVIEASR